MRLLALTGIVGISLSAIFVKLAGVEAGTSAFFRCAYAVPMLLVAKRLGPKGDLTWKRGLAFLTGALLAVDLFTWHVAIGMIGAGPATVLANTQVLFVAAASWRWCGERPTRVALFTVPLVLVGIALMSGVGATADGRADLALGSVLGTVCGITYAGFLILFRAANPQRAPTTGPLLDATLGAAATMLVLGLASDTIALAPSWPAHAWLLGLAAVCQTAAWLVISYTLPRLPVLETSVMLLLQPLLTAVWGIFLFAEAWTLDQGAGALLVLGGVTVLSLFGTVRAG